ncbi:hypothetical protein P0D75_34665 [Paraburkholderia sediminicola]|uniref:hypothetical protein n=1 Tax=Paraburkholderia sediminicola TaxID=458836 RepID=UPI000EB09B8E
MGTPIINDELWALIEPLLPPIYLTLREELEVSLYMRILNHSDVLLMSQIQAKSVTFIGAAGIRFQAEFSSAAPYLLPNFVQSAYLSHSQKRKRAR